MDRRNQQRLMQYNTKRIQHLIDQQKLAWLAQAGSQIAYMRRINAAHCANGFKHVN